jgi:hypothetical protein
MNRKRLIVAAAGLLALPPGAVAVAQDAAVRAANVAFTRSAAGAGAMAASTVVSGPDVVVTYANNRSSVVVTGQRFAVGGRVGETVPANRPSQ